MAHNQASRFVDYFVICGYDHTKGRPGGRESCSQVGRNKNFRIDGCRSLKQFSLLRLFRGSQSEIGLIFLLFMGWIDFAR